MSETKNKTSPKHENKKQSNNQTKSKTKSTSSNQKSKNNSSKNVATKSKINWKEKYEKLETENTRLASKLFELEIQNQENLKTFEDKAKGFQLKAQQEIDKIKHKLRDKFEKDSFEVKKYGSQKIVQDIIEPLLNLEMAIISGEKQGPEVQAYVKGFEMLMLQFHNILSSHGVVFIEPKVGDKYDPEIHEAFSTQEGKNKDLIISVKKKGLKLHNRIIKPAIVIIEK